MNAAEYRFEPVTPLRAADLERFSRAHGKFRYCSCQRWRLPSGHAPHRAVMTPSGYGTALSYQEASYEATLVITAKPAPAGSANQAIRPTPGTS